MATRRLLLSVLTIMLPLVASADARRAIIHNIAYELNYDARTAKVTSYEDEDYNSCYRGNIVIPSSVQEHVNGIVYSVTSIGADAFSGSTGLTSVTIPNSVTSIGRGAFSGCIGLTSVNIFDLEAWCKISCSSNPLAYANHLFLNGQEIKDLVIPNSVTSIGMGAFSGYTGLTSVTIPNSVTSIGGGAFSGCTGLTSMTIPNSVTSIDASAFQGCTGLTSVTIPNSVTFIGCRAFEGSCLTSVNITDLGAWSSISFESFDANPLYYAHHLFLNGKEVKELVIPNSVTSIGESAFSGCYGLTSVTIPNSVTSIGNYAFFDCNGLTSVTIPNSVTSIGADAFSGCI